MSAMIRVLLAEDHPLMRVSVRTTLTAEQDIALAGEATTADEAQRLCQALQPDVLLLDLNMPGPPPVETVAYVHRHCPPVRVLVLSAHDDDTHVREMVGAGVAGYVLKGEAPEALIQALRSAVQGGT